MKGRRKGQNSKPQHQMPDVCSEASERRKSHGFRNNLFVAMTKWPEPGHFIEKIMFIEFAILVALEHIASMCSAFDGGLT